MPQSSISRQVLFGFVAICLAVAAIAAFIAVSVRDLSDSGRRVAIDIGSQYDAVLDVKLLMTEAHLWTEEIVGGDAAESTAQVFELIDEAIAFSRAILDGGSVRGIDVVPSQSNAMRAQVGAMIEAQERLRGMTQERFDLIAGNQGVGSEADAMFDQMYDDLVAAIAAVASSGFPASADQARLGDARYLLAHGHLLTAEILGGDFGEDFAEVTGSFDAAEAEIRSLSAADAKLSAIADGIATLRGLAVERYQATLARAETFEQADVRFDAGFDAFIAEAEKAQEVATDLRSAGVGNMDQALARAGFVAAVGLALFFTVFVLGFGLLKSRIISRVQTIAQVLSRLARGEADVAVPDWKSRDEIGALRDTVVTFRNVMEERERVRALEEEAHRKEEEAERAAAQSREAELKRQAEAERAERAAERARGESMARVQRELADVVEAVQAGDFSLRLAADLDDDGLSRVCEGVNRLIEMVERGLVETSAVLSAIAGYDLTRRMTGEFKGAFDLLQADVNNGTAALNSVLLEMAEHSSAFSGDAGNISAAVQDLARRSETTASHLEQTTAAVVEIDTAAKSAADSARQAHSVVDLAQSSARQSETVVENAVTAMNEISAYSSQISGVVSVINEIAFQTNLLALNAGVEAARAGESGRGFAVVASEVRALAQRSAESAQEIEALIGESRKRVDRGSQLVTEAGDAMRDMIGRISEIVETVTEIGNSAEEQTRGISDVNSAIGEIDRMTQQNAAMGEELMATAKELLESATAVSELVARFKLSDAKAGHAGRSAPSIADREASGKAAEVKSAA